MFSIEVPAGRLLVARIASPIDLPEVAEFRRTLGTAFAKIPGKAVICCDLRAARLFPPEVATAFVAIMKSDNPKLERSMFLCAEGAVFSLQIERMIREAGSPLRRAFRDAAELQTSVVDLLDEDERRGLRAFIEAGRASAGG